MTTLPFNPYPKSKQVESKRTKPTQRQMGDISDKVRQQVKERSGDVCEVLWINPVAAEYAGRQLTLF